MTETQDKYKPLIDYFERTAPLDDKEKQAVQDLFVYNSYKRKKFLLREGEVCRQLSIVKKIDKFINPELVL